VPSLKDVPTLDEQGLKGFEVSVWHAFYAPAKTPKPVVDKLVSALQEALRDPVVKQRFNDLGTDPIETSRANPQALGTFLKAEIDKWGPIIKKAGVYAD
jgi:tripartite-type tricarboxylate transporter receptor subunit TctC